MCMSPQMLPTILGPRTIVNAHVGLLSTAFHLVLLSTILAVFKVYHYCQQTCRIIVNSLVDWYRLDFPAGWPPVGVRVHPYEIRLG